MIKVCFKLGTYFSLFQEDSFQNKRKTIFNTKKKNVVERE